MALEARAFSAPGRRTNLRPLPDSPGPAAGSLDRGPRRDRRRGGVPGRLTCRCPEILMSLTMRAASYRYAGTSKPVLDGHRSRGRARPAGRGRRTERSRQVARSASSPPGWPPAAIGGRLDWFGVARRSGDGDAQAARGGPALRNPLPEPGDAAVGHEPRRSGRRSRSVRATWVCRSTRSWSAWRRRWPRSGSGTSPSATRIGCRADRPSSSPSRRVVALRPSISRPRRADEPARSGRDPPRRGRARPAGRGRHRRFSSSSTRRSCVERVADEVVLLVGGRVESVGPAADGPRRSTAWRGRRRSAAERKDRQGAGCRRPGRSIAGIDLAALESEPIAAEPMTADSLAGSG